MTRVYDTNRTAVPRLICELANDEILLIFYLFKLPSYRARG